jgi:ribosomal protein S12 methylthiotransferase
MISLGCAKNLVNSEQMLCMLDDAGLEIVNDPRGRTSPSFNTCGFINDAKVEAIDHILYLSQLKDQGASGDNRCRLSVPAVSDGYNR